MSALLLSVSMRYFSSENGNLWLFLGFISYMRGNCQNHGYTCISGIYLTMIYQHIRSANKCQNRKNNAENKCSFLHWHRLLNFRCV